MADDKKGIGLKYKLLAFMLAISIIPLSAVSFMAISNSRSMGEEAVQNTDEMGEAVIEDADSMGNTALQSAQEMGDKSLTSLNDAQKSIIDDLTDMGNETINQSTEVLTNVVKDSLRSKTNNTVDIVEDYMDSRIGNVLSMKYLKESPESYLHFAENHDSDILMYEFGGRNIYQNVPMFRDIYRIDRNGNIQINVGYNVSSPYSYEDFEEEEWQDIGIVNNDANVQNYTADPADDTEFVEYGLRDVYETLEDNPEEYKDKVYFPKVTIEVQGQERTTNLLKVDPDENLANAVWMAATPVFTEGGQFDGMVVANINHLHIMKIISDFSFGNQGYATLSEITGEQANIPLEIQTEDEWDQYVTSDGEPVPEETYKELPNGEVVHYGDEMENTNLGVIIYHPKTQDIGELDIVTREATGSPILAYLGDQMHSEQEGMLVYNTYVGDVWGAYKPVQIESDKTSNLNGWSIVCNALRYEFTRPMDEIENIMDQSIVETRDETSNRIEDLEVSINSDISNLETSITTSKDEMKGSMEAKKEETTQEIDESVSQLQNTVMISVVVILVIVAVSAYLIADRIVTPIKELTDLADRVSQGEMDLAVEVDASDEIGELAESFNRMINSLKIAMETLEEEM